MAVNCSSSPSTQDQPRKETNPSSLRIDLRYDWCTSPNCVYRILLHAFSPWGAIYPYFWLWRERGIWEQILGVLRRVLRINSGQHSEHSTGVIDNQSVKTTSTPGVHGYAAEKKVNGRKRHILMDTQGNLLKVVVHAANIQDRDGVKRSYKMHPFEPPAIQLIWVDEMGSIPANWCARLKRLEESY